MPVLFAFLTQQKYWESIYIEPSCRIFDHHFLSYPETARLSNNCGLNKAPVVARSYINTLSNIIWLFSGLALLKIECSSIIHRFKWTEFVFWLKKWIIVTWTCLTHSEFTGRENIDFSKLSNCAPFCYKCLFCYSGKNDIVAWGKICWPQDFR